MQSDPADPASPPLLYSAGRGQVSSRRLLVIGNPSRVLASLRDRPCWPLPPWGKKNEAEQSTPTSWPTCLRRPVQVEARIYLSRRPARDFFSARSGNCVTDSMDCAASRSSIRIIASPRQEMFPTRLLSPESFSLGVNPSTRRRRTSIPPHDQWGISIAVR